MDILDVIGTVGNVIIKSLFYCFVSDQSVESSLQVKISSPARTVSVKQEPEDHPDLSKCLYLMYW